jgi:hypothetical protein
VDREKRREAGVYSFLYLSPIMLGFSPTGQHSNAFRTVVAQVFKFYLFFFFAFKSEIIFRYILNTCQRRGRIRWSGSKLQSSHRKDRQVQSGQNGFLQTEPTGLREKLVSEIKFERHGCGEEFKEGKVTRCESFYDYEK